MLARRQFNVRTKKRLGEIRGAAKARREGTGALAKRWPVEFGLHSTMFYMNMNSCSYWESDYELGIGSKRFDYLAGCYARFAFRGTAPFTPWRLEGDADSICANVSADRLVGVAFVRSGGAAWIGMASWGDGAAAPYALAGSFFQRVFPGGVSEYVSGGGGCFRRLDALVLRRRIAWRESEVAEARMKRVELRIELL